MRNARQFFKPAYAWLVLALFLLVLPHAFGGMANLPGADESAKLDAAGTLLRLIDTGLFNWGARLFAGLCILSGAWALKEQRFAMAVIALLGAIVIGTAPTWVKNIFSISKDSSIFSSYTIPNQIAKGEPHGSIRQS